MKNTYSLETCQKYEYFSAYVNFQAGLIVFTTTVFCLTKGHNFLKLNLVPWATGSPVFYMHKSLCKHRNSKMQLLWHMENVKTNKQWVTMETWNGASIQLFKCINGMDMGN